MAGGTKRPLKSLMLTKNVKGGTRKNVSEKMLFDVRNC